MIVTGIAAKDYHKIIPLNPEDTCVNIVLLKLLIKQKSDEVVKEEILECADGRKKFDVLLIGRTIRRFLLCRYECTSLL